MEPPTDQQVCLDLPHCICSPPWMEEEGGREGGREGEREKRMKIGERVCVCNNCDREGTHHLPDLQNVVF